jgi:hypothetical protein
MIPITKSDLQRLDEKSVLNIVLTAQLFAVKFEFKQLVLHQMKSCFVQTFNTRILNVMV